MTGQANVDSGVPSLRAATVGVGTSATADNAVITDIVRELQAELPTLTFAMPTDRHDDAERERDQLVLHLRTSLIPRLTHASVPLLAVVAGSTGAGKSTLVNSLLEADVTAAGVLRPTTRQAIVVHHPIDGPSLLLHPLLHELVDSVPAQSVEAGPETQAGKPEPAPPAGETSLDAPASGAAENAHHDAGTSATTAKEPGAQHAATPAQAPAEPSDAINTEPGGSTLADAVAVQLVAAERMPRGLALIDAPDLDSVVDSNRSLARSLLDAADLWIFVTTANRYGDALPWETLDDAARRGVSTAVVLNRVSREGLRTVRADLAKRLAEHGVGSAPLFVVADEGPHSGRLEPGLVLNLRRWLDHLAGPARVNATIARTLAGALDALRYRLNDVVATATEQRDAVRRARNVTAETTTASVEAMRARFARQGCWNGECATRWSGVVTNPVMTDVFGRNDKPRGGRRGLKLRSGALVALRLDLMAAARAHVLAEAEGADRALLARWRDWSVTEDLWEHWRADRGRLDGGARQARTARQAATAWQDFAAQCVARFQGVSTDPARVSAVLGAFGEEGLATLLLAAAAYPADAERAQDNPVDYVTALLPGDAPQIIEQLRDFLVRALTGAVTAEAEPWRALIDEHAPDEAAIHRVVALTEKLAKVRS